jgi:hypothetical protein
MLAVLYELVSNYIFLVSFKTFSRCHVFIQLAFCETLGLPDRLIKVQSEAEIAQVDDYA